MNPSNQRRQPKRAGVWDKVASAAMDVGAYRNAFPTIQQTSTPWSGTSSRTNSNTNLQDVFPALPTASTHTNRRAEINAMLRKPTSQAWGDTSSSSSVVNESDYSDDNNSKKKKGKKGKQVLFRVGL